MGVGGCLGGDGRMGGVGGWEDGRVGMGGVLGGGGCRGGEGRSVGGGGGVWLLRFPIHSELTYRTDTSR